MLLGGSICSCFSSNFCGAMFSSFHKELVKTNSLFTEWIGWASAVTSLLIPRKIASKCAKLGCHVKLRCICLFVIVPVIKWYWDAKYWKLCHCKNIDIWLDWTEQSAHYVQKSRNVDWWLSANCSIYLQQPLHPGLNPRNALCKAGIQSGKNASPLLDVVFPVPNLILIKQSG